MERMIEAALPPINRGDFLEIVPNLKEARKQTTGAWNCTERYSGRIQLHNAAEIKIPGTSCRRR